MKAVAFTQHGLPIEDPNALLDMELPNQRPALAICWWTSERFR